MAKRSDSKANRGNRFAIYGRGSKDEQVITLDAQDAKCLAFGCAMDAVIVGAPIHDSASGKDMDRPGLQKILAMLRAGEIDGIIVAKLDRLTRRVRDLDYMLETYFSDGKYQLLSVNENIDTRSANGRMMVNMLAIIAQWERETIGERTSDALQAKIAKGEAAGNSAFGWDSVDGPEIRDGKPVKILVRNEAEQATIAEILDCRRSGASYSDLVEMKFPGRGGKALGRNTLFNIVKRAESEAMPPALRAARDTVAALAA
jgi:site-specific DNA recombinase